MKIKLSSLAAFKLARLLDYLESSWSMTSKQIFVEKLDKRFELIKANPYSFPESKFKIGLRHCVVTKQTSFFYLVSDNEINVVTIFDNRQNPKEITEEISKHFS